MSLKLFFFCPYSCHPLKMRASSEVIVLTTGWAVMRAMPAREAA